MCVRAFVYVCECVFLYMHVVPLCVCVVYLYTCKHPLRLVTSSTPDPFASEMGKLRLQKHLQSFQATEGNAPSFSLSPLESLSSHSILSSSKAAPLSTS